MLKTFLPAIFPSVISDVKQWYFVTKVVLTYCEKKNSSDRENVLKFKAENLKDILDH